MREAILDQVSFGHMYKPVALGPGPTCINRDTSSTKKASQETAPHLTPAFSVEEIGPTGFSFDFIFLRKHRPTGFSGCLMD
jgi:hypothetical protein